MAREDRGRPTADKVGMLSVRRCANGSNESVANGCPSGYGDFEKVLAALKATPADLHILSIHEGTELAPHILPGNEEGHQKREVHRVIEKFDLAESYGIDMIIGHHSHNVRAVRFQNNQLALFGLGNFLFLGGANMMNGSVPLRYGLFARAHFYVDQDKKISLSALEVIPLKNTHVRPEPWGAKDGAQFISYLNKLAKEDLGKSGVQFTLTKKGTGVFCVPNVKRGPRASALCGK